MKRSAKLVQARVTGLSHKGLAQLEVESGRHGLELWGPLPGEEVWIQLGQRRNLWLQRLDEPHPQRREARCQHYGPCGGCSLQHLTEAAQLEWKSSRLRDRLLSLQPELEWLPPTPSPQPFHYRTKVEFSFLRGDVGYHRRGCFDRGVAVEHCWIGPPAHRDLLATTRSWQREHGLSGWDPRKLQGDLRYMLVRQANPGDQWLAVLVTRTGLESERVQDWVGRISTLPRPPQGLVWVEQSSSAAAIVPEHEHLVFGHNQIEQTLGPLRFELGWRSFFQSNPPAYLKMLELLREWLTPLQPEHVLDLYCGIGSVGLFVAPPESRLTGVESVPEAIADARQAAQKLERPARFEVCPAEQWTEWECDVAIIDPPRSGCHPRLVENLAAHGPRNVFYISCNPERFLDEAARLKPFYELKRAAAFDFFPQTAHCELLVWLTRRDDERSSPDAAS